MSLPCLPSSVVDRLRALVAAGLAAALTLALLAGGAGTASAEDPEVVSAREQVQAAEALVGQLQARLDQVAAAYEQALAHHYRLSEEVGEADERLARASGAVEDEQRLFAERIAAAYRRPDTEVALAEALVLAPDPATFLHRAALINQVTARALAPVRRAEDVEERTADLVRQQRILHAGAYNAAEDRHRIADEFKLDLESARRQVSEAEAALRKAEEEAERRAAQRRAEEERARWSAAFAGMGPMPPVDGKVCPLGAPNAFIDSWGFPRSGGRTHKGVDMFAAYGMPIFAVADGRIARVYWNRLGGLSIDLIDDAGDRYYYAHLSAAHVEGGERVHAGDVIGANGDSGNARGTPPHLHWQYHPGNGPPVNPFPLARALCRPAG